MTYFAPTTLESALEILRTEEPQIVAGGTDFFPAQKAVDKTHPLLDLTRIDALKGISIRDDRWRIGATTTWTDISQAELPPSFLGLQQAAREVGSIQIQNAGTIAGNLCNASPAADGVPPLLTLGAMVELSSVDEVRTIPLEAFITGVRQTTRQPGEIVTAISGRLPPTHSNGTFTKLGTRRYLVISITMTAAVIGCDDQGHIDFARIAVGACSPVATRLETLEQDLIGCKAEEISITQEHLRPLSPIDDVRGSAEYRLQAVADQCERAIQGAL